MDGVMFATCAQCDADVHTSDVIGAMVTDSGRRLAIRCRECGVEGTMFLTYEELQTLAVRQAAWEEEQGNVEPFVGLPVDKPEMSSEELGRLLQGFRIELDVLDRDWDLIVEDWLYQERYRPSTIRAETGMLAELSSIVGDL